MAEVSGFETARKLIAEGEAQGRAAWLLLGSERDRDGFALKPAPWEGPGEYQVVERTGGNSFLVRVPSDGRYLPIPKTKLAA